MADIVTGPDTITVDLIDDLRADTITFHDAHGVELHRAPIVGRDAVVYHYDGPDGRTVRARAWTGDMCVFEFAPLTLFRGSAYRMAFDA